MVVISPAKKLDFNSESKIEQQTKPLFLDQTKKLITELKNLNSNDIGKIMKLSPALSELNYQRFQNFKPNFNPSSSKQAIFAFNGDTYAGLDAKSLSSEDIKTAQSKLRILSGLYGLLKPLDLIQAYRLEMGTKFSFKDHKSLYSFWGSSISEALNKNHQSEELINCASLEYFKAVKLEALNLKVITPAFKELRDGELKIISFSAKRARGMMARYIIQNNLESSEQIKSFDLDGYKFSTQESTESEFVFIR